MEQGRSGTSPIGPKAGILVHRLAQGAFTLPSRLVEVRKDTTLKSLPADHSSSALRLILFVMSAVLAGAGCASNRSERIPPQSALSYQLKVLQDPRPNRVHILRVDLAGRAVEPAVVLGRDPDGDGPAEARLTNPVKLAEDPHVLAYVNTNPWRALPDADGGKNHSWYEGQPVDIHGLAVYEGHLRSRSEDPAAAVRFDAPGRVFIGEPAKQESAVGAMEGFQPVVTDGALAVPPGKVRHPRTAIGVNKDGTVMWLVVVDGRQEGYSEGMTLDELGDVLLELGCWDAVNMDGGGSSILALRDSQGTLQIRNSPSDRLLGIVRVRPLPSILTIRERD